MKTAFLHLIAIAICFTGGCSEFLIPNGNGKPLPTPSTFPTPSPIVSPQRLEIVLRVDGEGRINVGGDGSINVKTSANLPTEEATRCECGCGKIGCACLNSGTPQKDLSRKMPAGSPADAQSGLDAGIHTERREASDLRSLKTSRDLFVLSVEGCAACDLAAADLARLGFDVRKVLGELSPNGLYPAIRNRRGKVYTVDDGVWNSGSDDTSAAWYLSQ